MNEPKPLLGIITIVKKRNQPKQNIPVNNHFKQDEFHISQRKHLD